MSMRPSVGAPAYPSAAEVTVAVAPVDDVVVARRALLVRLLLAMLAVTLLLTLWRPTIVRAQGRPGMVSVSGGAKAGSLATQTAGVASAPPTPAAPAAGAASAPSAPAVVVRTPTAGDHNAATTVPYRGALLVPSPTAERQGDTARLNFRPQVGKELAPRVGGTIGLVTGDEQRASRLATEGFTVFHRDLPDPVEAERRTRALLTPNVPAPRHGEYQAAPFPVEGARIARAPVVGTGQVSRAQGEPFPRRYRVDDEVPLFLPTGVTVAVGDRLAPVDVVGAISATVRVAAPAGVLEVVHVAPRMARAVVRSQSGTITEGQPLLPVVGEAAPWQWAMSTEGEPLSAPVQWTADAPRLPAPQGFVILGVGEAQGVQAGDRFALRSRTTPSAGPQEIVAQVRVVRVDRGTSSAKVTYINQPAFPTDLVAHRIARPVAGAVAPTP